MITFQDQGEFMPGIEDWVNIKKKKSNNIIDYNNRIKKSCDHLIDGEDTYDKV